MIQFSSKLKKAPKKRFTNIIFHLEFPEITSKNIGNFLWLAYWAEFHQPKKLKTIWFLQPDLDSIFTLKEVCKLYSKTKGFKPK